MKRDIDVDYQYDRKDDVIKSEADSNGMDKFCKIQTLGSLNAKGVIKDVLRVSNHEVALGNAVSKLIPEEADMTLKKAYEENPDLPSFIKENNIQKEWDIALKLEGLKKSASTHACGHIPVPVPCEELFPCRLDKDSGYLVCEYDMAEAEHLGNLKKDLLMLRNLTIISVAQTAIENRYGVKIPLWGEEVLNDEKALKLFWTGETNGVFQFESDGMKKFMKELQPTCFEDIIAGVSLYRPGPMDYIPDYIRGKHEPESIVYDFPELEEILAPTYGVITYQEQVMQIVQKLAGFSKGEADVVRKGMGKKKQDIIDAEGVIFVNGNDKFPGCVGNGYDKEIAIKLWDKMSQFGKYAFNKSHAACYAAVAMQTAYLKAHYPTEFFAGLLTSVADSTSKLPKYIMECKGNKLQIKNPDINSSGINFTSNDDGSITYGLSAIKGVGKIIPVIIKERDENGPYTGITDVVKRIEDINKKGLEALVYAGALDGFGYTRNTLIQNITKVQDNVKRDRKDQASGQINLFDLMGENFMKIDDFVDLKELPKNDLLDKEKAATGFYISGHPFEEYQSLLGNEVFDSTYFITEDEDDDEVEVIDSDNDNDDETSSMSDQSEQKSIKAFVEQKVNVAGILTDMKKFLTKKQQQMATFYLEDVYGKIKIVCFPKTYAKYKAILKEGQPFFINGFVNFDEQSGEYAISVADISDLTTLPVTALVRFDNMDHYKENEDKINEILSKYPGNGKLEIYLTQERKIKILKNCGNKIVHELKTIYGNENVIVKI